MTWAGRPAWAQARLIAQAGGVARGEAHLVLAGVRGGHRGLPVAARPARELQPDFPRLVDLDGVRRGGVGAAIIDEVTRAGRSDAGVSTGAYLGLAAVGRLVAPCSKLAFADWWAGTAAGRFTGIGTPALDHRRFWDAMHAVGLEELEEISPRIAPAIADASARDCPSLPPGLANFPTF